MKLITILVLLLCVNLSGYADTNNDSIKYEQPILLTSVGQAADVLILKGLCLRAGVDFRYRPHADQDSLNDCKSIILVAGGSSKGLGAAKIDPETEIERAGKMIKAAKKEKIPIIVFHIGGKARRGALSDPFNRIAAEAGEKLVVVKSGDEDGFFSKIAKKQKAGYRTIDKQIEVVDVLKELFGIGEKEDAKEANE